MNQELILEIKAEIGNLKAKLEGVRQQIEQFKNQTVNLRVNTKEAEAQLRKIRETLQQLQSGAQAKVTIDAQKAFQVVNELRQKLQSIKDTQARVKIDTATAKRELAEIEALAKKTQQALKIRGMVHMQGGAGVIAELKALQIEAKTARVHLQGLNRLSLSNLVATVMEAVRNIRQLAVVLAGLATGGTIAAITSVSSSFEMLRKKLELVIGDSQQASEIFKQLREASFSSLVPIEKLADAYIRLRAAGLQPTVQEIVNFANAAELLGTSSQAFELATMALTQMAAKGKIMMEELRQQLGEHIPVAIKKVAEAMGMSMPEFYQAIEQGKISVQEFYQTFMQVMGQIAQGVDFSNTFTALKIQFINTLKELAYILGKIGIFDAIKKAIKALTDFIKRNTPVIVAFARQLFLGFSTVLDILQPVIAVAMKAVHAVGAVLSTLMSLSLTVVNGLRMIYYAAKGDWEAVMKLDSQIKEAWRNTRLLWESLLGLDNTKVDAEVDVNTERAKRKLDEMQKELSEMTEVEMDVSVDVPEEEIDSLIEDIEKANPKLTLDIDTSLADQKLDMWLDEWQRKNELEFNVNTICSGDYTPSWDRC